MSDFTYQDLDDLDSAITDSVTLAEEMNRGKPTPEEFEYLARITALQLRIQDLMAKSPTRPSFYERFIVGGE